MEKYELIKQIQSFKFDSELPKYKNKLLNKNQFKNFISMPTQAWYILDNHNMKTTYSSNFYALFGWRPNPFKKVYDNIHPEDLEYFQQRTVEAYNFLQMPGNGKPFMHTTSLKYRIKVKNDYQKVLRQACVVTNDKLGNIVHTLALYTILIHVNREDPLSYYSIHKDSALSKREIEILELCQQGDTVNEIADKLLISHFTVQQHIKMMRKKIGAKNITSLIYQAKKNCWI